jgi:diguanylate cyclase (GGDEF)-like protein
MLIANGWTTDTKIPTLVTTAASPGQIKSAAVIAFVLLSSAVAATCLKSHSAVVAPGFIPLVAGIATISDLLAGFLLFAQFRVTGLRLLAVAGSAYSLTGLLSIAYVVSFPGVFVPGIIWANEQTSAWFWIIWHLAFPLVLASYAISDRSLRAASPLSSTSLRSRYYLGGVAIVAGAFVFLVFAAGPVLPKLVVHGTFEPLFKQVLVPLVILADIVAVVALLGRPKELTTLQLAIGLALLTATLDAFLNSISTERYSASWYVGKLEMFLTSTIVVVTLVAEISELYRRASELATIDALTGLENRRSLGPRLEWALGHGRREGIQVAFIMIDVDQFKKYNDAFGHAAGDQCLRRVSSALRAQLQRPNDLLIRFGGEEFIVLLVDTDQAGAQTLAERLRTSVEALLIRHAPGVERDVVTVSLGISVAKAASTLGEELLESADRALYAAKAAGRNCWTFEAPPHAIEAIVAGSILATQ